MTGGSSNSSQLGYSRRTVLKAGTAGVGATGVLSLAQTATAWDLIPVDLRCPSCEFLGKVEFSDDTTEIKDTQEKGVRKVDENTVEIDADLDGDGTNETVTIDFTEFYRKDSGEIIGFDFATDGTGICRVDVKGGPPPKTDSSGEKEYTDLGYIVHGSELYAPDCDDNNHKYYAVSYVEFYYCPTLRACILAEDTGFSPAGTIDVTDDETRFGIWWGPRHYDDDYVFERGGAPSSQMVGDFDDDSDTSDDDDICFEFPVTNVRDGVINSPRKVKSPAKMKGEFLIQETDDDEDLYAAETTDITVHEPVADSDS